jgi:hypothetical protein
MQCRRQVIARSAWQRGFRGLRDRERTDRRHTCSQFREMRRFKQARRSRQTCALPASNGDRWPTGVTSRPRRHPAVWAYDRPGLGRATASASPLRYRVQSRVRRSKSRRASAAISLHGASRGPGFECADNGGSGVARVMLYSAFEAFVKTAAGRRWIARRSRPPAIAPVRDRRNDEVAFVAVIPPRRAAYTHRSAASAPAPAPVHSD